MTRCKICQSAAELFDVVDFAKTCNRSSVYPHGLSGTPIYYLRCRSCGFIFTDHFDQFSDDEWREKVYNDRYIDADPEYVQIRPRNNARYLQNFLRGRKSSTIGLDFGGGTGLTAKIMVERGWQFDTCDRFSQNDVLASDERKYNVITAFEVFEHLTDPVATMQEILKRTSPGKILMIIGTGSTDGQVDEMRRLCWWYAAPRNGHISLYSKASLSLLASRFGLTCVSPSGGSHFFSRGIATTTILSRFALTATAMRARSMLRAQSNLCGVTR